LLLLPPLLLLPLRLLPLSGAAAPPLARLRCCSSAAAA
jgi:hypothetical protein